MFDKRFLERMDAYQASAFSVSIVKDNRVSESYAWGFQSAEKSRSIDKNTVFQAASISKTLNALAVLLLAERKQLSLDQDVNAYLRPWKIEGNGFTNEEKVTLRRILSHSAGTSIPGFPGYARGSVIPTTTDVLIGKKPVVNTEPVRLVHMPGQKFSYSGGGTTIAQLVIEETTGENYADWMQENILHPLGMSNSTFRQPEAAGNVAFGHVNGQVVDGRWRVHPELAAAGLWSASEDLAKLIVQMNNMLETGSGLLTSQTMNEMIAPQVKIDEVRAAGLGVILSGKNRDFRFWHNGRNEGYISIFVSYPEKKEGYSILANSNEAEGLIGEVETRILNSNAASHNF